MLSREACAKQVSQRLVDVSSECRNCVETIPCSGMTRIATGKVSLGNVCPACKGAPVRGECPAAHEHFLICGVATRPEPAASGSAASPPAGSASAAPASAAAPKGTGEPAAAAKAKP